MRTHAVRLVAGRGAPRLAAALAVAALAAATAAHATVVVPMSDPDLVRNSGLVLEGRVDGVRSEWNADRTQIHTVAEIVVGEFLKGEPADGTITLRLLGGTVGEITQAVVDGPTFRQDEMVILMLRPDFRQTLFPITGFYEGKLAIAIDPATGTRSVQGRGVSTETYLATLREVVAAQGR